ncbi:MAG: nucleotide-binding protein [Candidatus Thorarchaeota archaeon]|nr:nucleotide-binding protein [Candidatus Thorarchaeota archaeon]
MPLIVVIDTNFLLVPAQFVVDIFTEAERVLERNLDFVLLSSTLDELEQKLQAATNKTEIRHFKIAKELAKRCRIVESDEESMKTPVDDQVLAYAQSVKGVLATNDKELRVRARSNGVPVLILRGMKYLVVEGYVS